jgi:serine/threonine-protein kinase
VEIPIGETVGGYLLKRQLGAGGMGAVYLARHRSLPRDVALKVLHPAFATIPEFRGRFEREADLLCALEHSNVVDVLDKGQDGDLLWIAMQFVDGPDLHTALRERGPFPPERALEIVAAIGSALDHAHGRGLLHRDVKPANILLKPGADGAEQAMLTDFGIAKNVASVTPLTRDGQVPATVAYAAPEQVAGEPMDGRADVYSLGVVLFELLTGRRAFPQDDLSPLVASVLAGPVPDVRAVRPDLPAALAAVMTRALQKDPEARFATCAELVDAARTALPPRVPAPVTTISPGRHTGPPPPPSPLPPSTEPATRSQTVPAESAPGRRRWPVLAGIVLALVVATAVVIGVILAGGGDDPGGGQASGTSGATSGSTEAAGSTTAGSPVAAALGVGDCLAADRTPTACDGEHASEVYSTSGCTADELVAYLGGRSGFDVLRSDLALDEVPAEGGTACTVGLPSDTLDRSSDGVLGGDAGDEWRRCLDANDGEVPCSEEHTAEVIFVQEQSTDPLNCTARASEYLGTPFDRHSDALDVVESGSTCQVAVRGDNVLTASLRDLRSTALPLEAAG